MDFPPSEVFAFEQQSTSGQSERKTADKLSKTQKSAKVQKRASSDKKCSSCGTTNTPVWRWGGESKEVLLCNACSLRIRRSATKPQRAKSPNDLPPEKQTATPLSVEHELPSERFFPDFIPGDAEALRVQLLRCVEFHLELEKARLLGPREAHLADEESWANSQRFSPYAGSSSSSGSGSLPMTAPLPEQFGGDYPAHPYGIQHAYDTQENGPLSGSTFSYMEPGLVRML